MTVIVSGNGIQFDTRPVPDSPGNVGYYSQGQIQKFSSIGSKDNTAGQFTWLNQSENRVADTVYTAGARMRFVAITGTMKGNYPPHGASSRMGNWLVVQDQISGSYMVQGQTEKFASGNYHWMTMWTVINPFQSYKLIGITTSFSNVSYTTIPLFQYWLELEH